MTSSANPLRDRSPLWRAALMNGAINAVINGVIQAWLLRGQGPIQLSADSIGATEQTVLSGAVPLAVSLAMILTAIGWLGLMPPKRPFVPDTLWLIVKHGLLAFGAVVAAAVVWQRLVGSVAVSVPVAVVVLGVIAGVVAAAVSLLTPLASEGASQ